MYSLAVHLNEQIESGSNSDPVRWAELATLLNPRDPDPEQTEYEQDYEQYARLNCFVSFMTPNEICDDQLVLPINHNSYIYRSCLLQLMNVSTVNLGGKLCR